MVALTEWSENQVAANLASSAHWKLYILQNRLMNLVWLIDIGYITKASKAHGKIDYLATKNFLEKKFNLPCIPIIFNSVDGHGVELGLKQFYFTMEKAGFIINLYRMEGGAQKQVDVAIGSHLVYYAMKRDTIVLSSGDIDFVPAIHVAKKDHPNINITLLTFNFGVSDTLAENATDQMFFTDYPEMLRK
jgi:uncharacterized LabA/DUF88 family protein